MSLQERMLKEEAVELRRAAKRFPQFFTMLVGMPQPKQVVSTATVGITPGRMTPPANRSSHKPLHNQQFVIPSSMLPAAPFTSDFKVTNRSLSRSFPHIICTNAFYAPPEAANSAIALLRRILESKFDERLIEAHELGWRNDDQKYVRWRTTQTKIEGEIEEKGQLYSDDVRSPLKCKPHILRRGVAFFSEPLELPVDAMFFSRLGVQNVSDTSCIDLNVFEALAVVIETRLAVPFPATLEDPFDIAIERAEAEERPAEVIAAIRRMKEQRLEKDKADRRAGSEMENKSQEVATESAKSSDKTANATAESVKGWLLNYSRRHPFTSFDSLASTYRGEKGGTCSKHTVRNAIEQSEILTQWSQTAAAASQPRACTVDATLRHLIECAATDEQRAGLNDPKTRAEIEAMTSEQRKELVSMHQDPGGRARARPD